MPRFLFVLLAIASAAAAIDVPLAARTLTILDADPSDPVATIKFVARDLAAGISKGTGSDVATIAAHITIDWESATGVFEVPAGARLPGASVGWIKNDAAGAKFTNRAAVLGTPTGVSSLAVTEGKGLKLVARTAGDVPLDLVAAALPTFGLQVVLTIANGTDRIRHCTVFPPDVVQLLPLGAGRKLIAKNGLARECPAEPMTLAPAPVLPPTPPGPSLWFDGNDPLAVAAVMARTTHADTSPLYAAIVGTVDGSLASLGAASDDTRARVAKGAGVLHVVGAIPPGPSGYASYRDVVVTALTGIGNRTAADTVAEFVTPPPNVLDVLRDAGRLQSMAEAYDLIRGSGVLPFDDAAMRTRIANWADEYLLDWNLIGDPFGIFAGHLDNWAIKAGSAIVTAALALPDHPNAGAWLTQGVAWINDSLATVVRGPGWYGESPHYLNYSLNNLVSTAWHLRNAAATDWFDDLEPFVAMAMATRQPDGQHAPFEEGVTNTFPWDVLAGAYPARAPQMAWALAASPGDFGAYDNQQFHTVTRFFVQALGVMPAAPTDAPTQFLDGDTHLVALRSDWSDAATQVTGLTTIDTSSDESFASRHHMENPLDLVMHGAGALLLPTASGGPTVTTSPNRAYYLLPSSKNIPLVDGNAPYVLEPLAVTLGDTLDSRDAGSTVHRLLDTATTTVAAFAPGVDVARTMALVGNAYGVVVDRFTSPVAHAYGVTWRGRGDGTVRASAIDHVASDHVWPNTATPSAHLAIDTTSAAPLTGSLVAGFYAPSFGVEESLDPLAITTSGNQVTLLTALRPRVDGDPASVFTPLAVAGGAGATVTVGSTIDTLLAGPGGVSLAGGGVVADGRLAITRSEGATVTGMAGVRATHVEVAGSTIAVDAAATFAATLAPGVTVVTVAGAGRYTVTDLPNLDPSATHVVTFDGLPLPPGDVADGGSTVAVTLPGPGVLRIADP